MNDVDIEMVEMTERGNMAAAGVCPACEDALDPMNPKWRDGDFGKVRQADGTYRPATREEWAACVGPESREIPGYHKACVDSWRD